VYKFLADGYVAGCPLRDVLRQVPDFDAPRYGTLPMKRIPGFAPFATTIVPFALLAGVSLADDPPKPAAAKLKVTLSKETTYFTRPVAKNGYVDYAAAINERLSGGVTPENNAAVGLIRVMGPAPEGTLLENAYFERLGIPALPLKGDYFLPFSSWLKERKGYKADDARFDAAFESQTKAMAGPWAAADHPLIAGWLAANDRQLDAIVEAVRRPRYFSPLVVGPDNTGDAGGLIAALLPHVGRLREFARAMTARAMLRLGEGNVDAAWKDLMAGHQLGRLVGQGPMLIEMLVGIAIDSVFAQADVVFVSRANLDAKRAAACLRDLQSLPPLPKIADKIDLGERCVYLDSMTLIARGGPRAEALGVEEALAGVLKGVKDANLSVAFWDASLKTGNRWYDRLVSALKKPTAAQRKSSVNAIAAELRPWQAKAGDPEKAARDIGEGRQGAEARGEMLANVLAALLVPSVTVAHQAEDRSRQMENNLVVALALAVYRAEKGRYPKTLAELAPAVLKSIPSDVFTDKPPVYKLEGEGYLLYSVGPDGEDDGGQSREDDPPRDDLRIRQPAKTP